MKTRVWYNEIDPFKAEVLREAIKAGAIAPGDVDERSIADVRGSDLAGYAQCHFFAGGGFWSLALRNAGWPDDRPVWTGSCPCPSFSAAGKGEGFDDARHLWPQWYSLIRERRPGTIFGEQVAAAIGHGWLDLVSGDMEAEGYAIAAAVLGAHSAGAPHIRQRLYFGAHTEGSRWGKGSMSEQHRGIARRNQASKWDTTRERVEYHGEVSQCADTDGGNTGAGREQRGGKQRLLAADCGAGGSAHAERDGGRADFAERTEERRVANGRDCATGNGSDTTQRGLAMCGSAPGNAGHATFAGKSQCGSDAGSEGLPQLGRKWDESPRPSQNSFGILRDWRGPGWLDPLSARSVTEAGATGGFWADCDWWYGRDEKYRPIGSGLFPLAHGSPARVGRLRMYGDAICIPTAQIFIESYLATQG